MAVLGLDGQSGSVVCDIDWSRDQHLRRGWMSARIPAHFRLRRGEARRLERLPLSRDNDGSVHVTNQLGASIKKLWLVDDKGTLYTAEDVTVGQRAALSPTGKVIAGNARLALHRSTPQPTGPCSAGHSTRNSSVSPRRCRH